MTAHKLRIPLEIFEKMANQISPVELAKLPPEKLPLYIPQDIVSRIPRKSVSAMEDLLFSAEIHRMGQRMAVESDLGHEAAEAVDIAANGGSAVLNGLFAKRFEETKAFLGVENKIDNLRSGIKALDNLVSQIRDDAMLMVEGVEVLAHASIQVCQSQAYLKECYATSVSNLQRLLQALDEYALFKLQAVGADLMRLGNRAKAAKNEVAQLAKGIPETEKQIRAVIRMNKIPPAQVAGHPSIQALQNQLVELRKRKSSLEVLVSKEDLYGYLDMVVDGLLIDSINVKVVNYCQELWSGLAYLVLDHCRSALSLGDQSQAMMQAGDFIVAYFNKKQQTLKDTCGELCPKKFKLLARLRTEMVNYMDDL